MKFSKPFAALLTAASIATAIATTSTAFASDQVPGEVQNVALVGGTIYTAAGEPIEGGILVIENGKIKAVGKDIDVPEGFEQLDVSGKRVYPGLIEASTDVGLAEIDAVRTTIDYSEEGPVNPNAVAAVAVNPDSEIIPTTRANGVLLTHSHPSGGIVSGQGSLMQLDGWTWEDMTVARSTGLILNWPNMLPRQSFFFAAAPEEQMSRRDEQLQQIEDLFDTAERYKLARENESIDFDARYEAMIPFLEGERPIFVDANESQQIQLAVAFCQRRGLKMVLLGGRDAGKVTEVLKAADVPVILIGTQRSPGARDASYDEAYRLPAVLHEAGVKFAIASDRRNSMARNLPYHVGAAIGFGLPEDVALACVTSHAAEILGVSDRVGTLEAGKDATLFVADGDIFETPTQVTHAWIGGRRTDLSSRHTQLNDKYKQRYGQE